MSVAARTVSELTVQRSRFIACCAYIERETDFAAFLSDVRKDFSGATHYCTAFALSPGEGIARFSDDGEPPRTAGLPLLEAVRGRGLYRTGVVAVRYFGGVKLGTGGLSRAYADAAALVLDRAPVQRFVPSVLFTLTCPYPLLPAVTRALSDAGADVTERDYGEDARLSAACPQDTFPAFKAQLAALSGGRELTDGVRDGLHIFK